MRSGSMPASSPSSAVLVLRGPQTSGELRTRTERQHRFESLEAVEAALQALDGRDEPLALEVPRQPGQHQIRWVHLLGGEVDLEHGCGRGAGHRRASGESSLETEVAELRAARRRARARSSGSEPPNYS